MRDTASTDESNESISTFLRVSEWLHGLGTSAVSHFVFLCLIDADAFDLKSSVFAPRLPQRPELHGKPIQPSDILFRFPPQSDCVNASKVSLSAVSC